MSTNTRFVTLARTAALSASLLTPVASCAWAQQTNLEQIYAVGQNNDFGAQQDAAAHRAAAAVSTALPTAAQQKTLTEQFRVGQNNDFGTGRASEPTLSPEDYQSRLASTVPMVGGKPDLVGAGGRQEELAREIYTPGRGTFFDR
jgi:hypothetical protein